MAMGYKQQVGEKSEETDWNTERANQTEQIEM